MFKIGGRWIGSDIAVDDIYSMLSSEQRLICDKQITEIVVHNHNPVNDAEFVYMQYVMAMKHRLA